jgi:predicted nuclease of predicted toxin-antitoxin system
VKLVLDEHLSPEIARQLQGRGHDVVTARELVTGRDREDAVLLAAATQAGRAVVTADVVDFIELHRAAVTSGRAHAGILLISGRRYPSSRTGIGRLESALEAFLLAHPAPNALEGQARWLA